MRENTDQNNSGYGHFSRSEQPMKIMPFTVFNQMVRSPTSLNERCRTEIENPTSGQISDYYVNLRYLFQTVFNILV